MKNPLYSLLCTMLYTLSIFLIQPVKAQDVGVFTTSPQAPFHVWSTGQVNVPGGLVLMGDRDEGHLELDFNRVQSRFAANAYLTLDLQSAGGDLNIGSGLLYADESLARVGINTSSPGHTLDVAGNAGIDQFLFHNDDPGTYLNFSNDLIEFEAGDETLVRINAFGQDEVKLGDGGDVDINLNNAVHVRGDNDRVGINHNVPGARLHIASIFGEPALQADVSGLTRFMVHANGGVSVGSTVNPPTFGMYVSGDVGIGAISPDVRLHVSGGDDAGLGGGGYLVLGNVFGTNMVMDDNEIMARSAGAPTDMLLQHNGGQVGIGTTPSDKLHINSGSGENALRVQVNGSTRLRVESSGDVGIGTTNPSTALHINHGSSNGLRIQVTTTDDRWRLDTDAVDGDLNLYANGAFRGSFDSGNGNYNAASDARLKKNVSPLGPVLHDLLRLRMHKFQMVEEADSTRFSVGLIAQEVQSTFPDLVSHSPDAGYYTVDYQGLSVIAMKALQEQQVVIEQLQEENREIRRELAEIHRMIRVDQEK